ncbi:hypothetical protein BLA60_06040 [Actinophytocola xinjiangensis]|uniref:Guanylate cyclase domain-containing protein n=1 Tax=Actinophytocola xinjiangensis TaxID=485602 RepID=A0A7Z0WQ66_9PSEU|nr:hypothetical protein [Actinophytocola xinjiangensis]OLF12828.1 hypothetical protein BLA60_06040 [Actinophytocola xinjiangensis]
MADQPGEVTELPPYRAVLVVDAKDFGGNSDPDQELLAEAVPGVVALAFERAGLGQVFREALFPHNSGDGLGIGFDTRHLPGVVSHVFDALQAVLAERDRALRARGRGLRLRLRASLNIGPVREPDPRGRAGVVGQAVIATHRMLDASAVRDVLTRSDPEVTFLAVALSQRVFHDVVASGYARLSTSRLVPVAVRVKEFADTVHLYVPTPSGELLAHGVDGRPGPEPAPPAPPPAGVNNTISGGTHTGTTIQVGHLHGLPRDHRSGQG